MVNTNNGGPAFPCDEWQLPSPGMTLRDWFAGQALTGLLMANYQVDDVVAREAYDAADAMLAAREKTNETL
jgi:hypothetical protein